MGYLGQKICERMVSWEFCNFFWNDKSCCYNLLFLFKESESINIHDISYGDISYNSVSHTHYILLRFAQILRLYTFQAFNSWKTIINLMYFNVFKSTLRATFHKFTTKLYYLLYTSFLSKTTHLRVIFNLNIYIIVLNNEMCSISWIQKYVCKRRRKMVSFIFMTMLNDIHLMFKSWEIWDNSIVANIAKILPYAT